MELRVFDIRDRVTVLGPGVRFTVWVQGCSRRCPGCMSPNSQALDGGYVVSTKEVADAIISSGREGVTISGGEPFLQAEALAELISLVKAERNIGVIIYTGYTLGELLQLHDQAVDRLLGMCDLLVDGEYVEELNDGKNLRGSSNQRAIPLTERYANEAQEYGSKPAMVEFFYDAEGMCMVGVPTMQMLERFKNAKF